MGSICVPPCPTLRIRQGVLQLVSFTLKKNNFRALFSIFLMVFRGCCLKYLHAPFCSSVSSQGHASLHWGVTNGEQMLRIWAGFAVMPWPGCWFWVFPLGYQLCPWSGVRQGGACVPCSPQAVASHPSPSPGVLFPGAGAEAGQAEPARQAVLGRAACALALAEQGVQSRLPPHTAFPVFLLPRK